MKKLYLLLIVLGCLSWTQSTAQVCNTCDSDVPTFYIDLSNNADTIAQVVSNRSGHCCAASGSQRCIRFVVTVNAETGDFAFTQQPGNNGKYQIDCGPLIDGGTKTCLGGKKTFCVTYCNPGGNSDTYTLQAMRGFGASEDLHLRAGCTGRMTVSGLSKSSITWTSIYPGSVGAYNSYLSATTNADTVYVTPAAAAPGSPSYIDYRVCGTADGCVSGPVCDTVRVYTYPALTGTILPANPALCQGSNATITLDAQPAGGRPPYTYSWAGPGVASATTPSVVVSQAGTYTVTVNDNTACGPITFSRVVTQSQIPVVSSAATGTVCSGASHSYTIASTVTGTTYTWSRPVVAGISNGAGSGSGSVITETLVNTGTVPVQVQYFIQPSANGCAGNTFTYTLTVNPSPQVSSTASSTVCSANPQSYVIESTVAGSTFLWSRPSVPGISNAAVSNQSANPITETLFNTTANPVTVSYQITPVANGCAGQVFQYSVTVRPSPAVSSAATGTVCSGASQTYTISSGTANTSFVWSREATAGIAEPAIYNQASASITEALTNTTSQPMSVVYQISPSAGGCTGATFSYTVTVSPRPVVTSDANGSICSGSAQNYTINSNVPGSTFTWSRAQVAGINNGAVSNQTANPITEVLVNTTNAPITVTYQVNATAQGCTGETFTYRVQVQPSPQVTSNGAVAVCSNNALNYLIEANVAGTSFTWSRAAVPGISNAAASNRTENPIAERLLNTGSSPVDVAYTISPVVNGCAGQSFTLNVRVNPSPLLVFIDEAEICNNTSQNTVLNSNTTGTTYSWSRPAVAGISNTPATNQTSNPITETLNNTTNAPVNVVYTIEPFANGCSGGTYTYSVTVQPTAVINSNSNGTTCSGSQHTYNISSNINGASYTWSRAAVPGISNAAANGTGNTISETLVNTTTSAIPVVYRITPRYGQCDGEPFTYTLSVLPKPQVTSESNATVCNQTSITYDIRSNIDNSEFIWSRPEVAGISNAPVYDRKGNQISEALVNATSGPVTVVYYITATANGCGSETFLYSVTVMPTANITSSARASTCSGDAQDYSITSDVANASFRWSRPATAGISNAAVSNQTSPFIRESLVNTTSAPVSVVYQIVASTNNCSGPVFDYTVTVNPRPVITSTATGTICSGVAQPYRVQSNVAGSTFTWSRPPTAGISNAAVSNQNTDLIDEALVNTTSFSVTVNYQIQATANGCAGGAFSYAVTVQPVAIITSTASATVCNNTAQNYTIRSSVNNASIRWSRPAVNGISNAAVSNQASAVINESLTNTTRQPLDVVYFITPSVNGCDGETFRYTVTVMPAITITSAAADVRCSGQPLSYLITSDVAGASYSWSRAAVNGINNPGTANQTSNPISETLVNSTNASITVRYTIVPSINGCQAAAFEYAVTVHPTARISSAASATICNNTAQQYDIAAAVSGTSFTWSRPAVNGIANPAVSDQSSSTIREALVNTTNAPVAVAYTIVPSANGCEGSTFTYTVTVNPSADVTSDATATLCSGNAQNYTITSGVPGTSFTWSRAAVNGITNAPVTNQPGNSITETLTSNTTAPVTVHYTIIPSYNNCTGQQFDYAVTVNPRPQVTSDAAATVCNNVPLQYIISSDVSGATFTWSRASVAGISNAPVTNRQSVYIDEALNNTSGSPVTVPYTIVASSEGCSGPAFTYNVTVNPMAKITSAARNEVCNNTAQNYTITGNVAAANYVWTRAAVAGISNAPTTGSNRITETLQNTTQAPITVQYRIEPRANGCDGETFSYAVTVQPTPVVTSADGQIICNRTPFTYNIASNVPGANFTWSRSATPGISNPGMANQQSSVIAETLNNTTDRPVDVKYFIVPSANNCSGPVFSYTVTVNPSARINSARAGTVCNKDLHEYTITSPVANTTFTWSRALVPGIANPAAINQRLNPISETLTNQTQDPIDVVYIITATANDCEAATFTYTLTVKPTPQAPAASSNAPICIGSSLYLKASSIAGASYQWTGPNGFSSNQQNPVVNNVTSAIEGQYQVVAIVNGCRSTAATTDVRTANLSAIADAGSNQTVCANNAFVQILGKVTGGAGSGAWSTSGSGVFGDASSLATDYTPSADDIRFGGVNLTLTTTNNGICAATSSTIRISITPAPLVDAGPDIMVCADKPANLRGAVTVASGGVWSTTGSGVFYPSNTDMHAQYAPSQADKIKGTIAIALTSTGNGNCNAVADTVLVKVIPLPFVKAGGEVTVMEGKQVKITPTVAGNNLQFLWTPNRHLSNNTVKDITVLGVADEVYTIKVTGDGGCEAQDKVAVKVLKPFEVPNTFTPNGDGINDAWLIPNLAKYPNAKVMIFNRYGQVVYESAGYANPWDGLYQGKPLPFGTYYYIIDTGTGTPARKGFVTLIR